MTDTSSKSFAAKVLAFLQKRANIHFVVALVVLLIVGFTIQAYGWLVKKPVPWPEGVEVDGLHRNLSMPGAFPDNPERYVAITEGDPYYHQSDAQEGSDRIIEEDNLSVLGMTTIYDDEERLANRSANWYGNRYYRDTQADAYSPFAYWLLEVYYYGGLRDQVPHVPNTCLGAAGAEGITSSSVVFRAPGAREPWNEDLVFQRVSYIAQGPSGEQLPGVTYYLLGVNDAPVNVGDPTGARLVVRYVLSSRDIYNYFVKIQFSPLARPAQYAGQGTLDSAEADRAAQEFVENFMPKVLELLPSGETIKELEDAEKAGDN